MNTLQRFIICLIIGTSLSILSFYMLTKLSPFKADKVMDLIEEKQIDKNDWELLNEELSNLVEQGLIFDYLSSNAYLVFVLMLSSLFFYFVGIHLAIDKLFFKKFYENPLLMDAVRRGIICCLIIILLIYGKLYLLDIYTLLAIPVVALALEVGFFVGIRPTILRKMKKLKESKTN